MQRKWLLVLFLGVIRSTGASRYSKENSMQVIYKWKHIDYNYPSKEEKESAIKSGKFNYTNCAPIDVDKWNDKVFMTVIRDDGVPSSLNTVSEKIGEGGPLLEPYPDWSWASTDSCDNIISVYRVDRDRCNRLWVLDTGVSGNDHICPAKLLVFDLTTSKLLKRITIPDDVARNSTTGQGLLVTPVVLTFGSDCRDILVFMSDVEGHGLISYDGETFHRFTSPAFRNDPKYSTYGANGKTFQLTDGILGMAYSPFEGKLYFSSMSSHNFGSVDVKTFIKSNETKLDIDVDKHFLKTRTVAKAVSSTAKSVFFGMVDVAAIGCYNPDRARGGHGRDTVAVNSETLRFASGLKVRHRGRREKLWALTNRYQEIGTGTMDFTKYNFRILVGDVRRLTANTNC